VVGWFASLALAAGRFELISTTSRSENEAF
jgi:hypothetical protein